MSVIDDLLRSAGRFESSFDEGDLPVAPARRLLVLARMDSRIDLSGCSGWPTARLTSSTTPGVS